MVAICDHIPERLICADLREYVSTSELTKMIGSRRGNEEPSAEHSNSYDSRSEGCAQQRSCVCVWRDYESG
jgi:hypothetical protein